MPMSMEYLSMFWMYGNAQAGIDFYNQCKKKGVKCIIAYDFFGAVLETIDYEKPKTILPDCLDVGAGI